MPGYSPFTSLLVLGLGLPLLPVAAQIKPAQYLVGTEGILAGSLPSPGVYFEDLNWYGSSSSTLTSGSMPNDQISQNYQVTTYVNQPRLRWITPTQILGG